jgi:hypothetical protein
MRLASCSNVLVSTFSGIPETWKYPQAGPGSMGAEGLFQSEVDAPVAEPVASLIMPTIERLERLEPA